MSEILHAYFRGERVGSLYFLVPYRLGCLALAVVALRVERGGFGLGLAIPLALLGLLGLGVGGAVGLRTPAQVAALETQLAQDPTAFLATELPRMERVNQNWGRYLAGYVAFLVIGAGLRFGLKAELAQGLGIGLIFFGASGLIIDGFAERRAQVYTTALGEFARAQGDAD